MRNPTPVLLGHRSLRGRVVYGVALTLFALVLLVAWSRLPPLRITWAWLAATALLAPVTLLLNALEYCMAGRILSQRIPLREALSVTVLSTAANLLPLPGAVMVRSQALRDRGSEYKGAFRSTAAVGVGWLGTAFFLAGGVQLIWGKDFLGMLLALLGAATLAVTPILARGAPSVGRWLAMLVALESVFVMVSALRLLFVFLSLGIPASLAQVVVVTLAGAVASAAGIFPGGLGLRELLAGGFATMVEIPAAAGAVGAAVDRIVGLAMLALVAAATMTARKGIGAGGGEASGGGAPAP